MNSCLPNLSWLPPPSGNSLIFCVFDLLMLFLYLLRVCRLQGIPETESYSIYCREVSRDRSIQYILQRGIQRQRYTEVFHTEPSLSERPLQHRWASVYTVYSVQCTVYTIHCTVYSFQYPVYSLNCRVYINNIQFTLYSEGSVLQSIQHTLCKVVIM